MPPDSPSLLAPQGANNSNPDRWQVYTANWPAATLVVGMAAGAPFNIQTDSRYDFLWSEIAYYACVGDGGAMQDATRVIPEVFIQVFQVNEPFSDVEVPLSALAGDGRRPYQLPVPYWISGGTQLRIMARNNSAATAYNLWLSLSGIQRSKSTG